MRKHTISLIISLSLFYPLNVFANHSVDTIEPFEIGIVSNQEAYYAYSRIDHDEHDITMALGGGITQDLSYLVETQACIVSTVDEPNHLVIGGSSLGLIWNFWGNPAGFNVDLLPVVTLEANQPTNTGTVVRPDFQAYEFANGFEISYHAWSGAVPFARIGYAIAWDESDSQGTLPVLAGVAMPIGPMELLAQLSVTFDEPSFQQSEKAFGLGVNITITDSVELINGLVFSLPQDGDSFGWGLSMGYIYTMD